MDHNPDLFAHKVWISRCKKNSNFVVYCLFENMKTKDLELHSLGKYKRGLLGLGEGVEEALWFKKIALQVKIETIEGVDIRCGRDHTFISLNGNQQVYVLGCYDNETQAHEEVKFEPTLLKLHDQFDILKIGTESKNTAIVARKK